MQVGRRIAKLRAAHGESLRDAAMRTGVSHTTIARIEKGEVTASFHSTLRKIADGYGVRMEYLLTGRDPRHDFESAIRRLPPEERSRLYFASPRTRIKMVLDFLMAEYPNEFSVDRLAESVGIDLQTFQALLDGWPSDELPEEVNTKLAEALSRVTGISPHWFRCGSLDDQSDGIPKEMISAYVNLMKKAATNGIQPEMLDMAIDLLIMKQKELRSST
ncbi:MAG TPA: helix-turn-helix transcriptional regulator [Symbiobacteriaceae bacterium]